MDEFYPLIASAVITPNPAYENMPTILRVSVADILNPEYEVLLSGELWAEEAVT